MSPYYSRRGVWLYNADCEDLQVECDLIVADPPYGQAYVSGRSSGEWGAIAGDEDATVITEKLNIVLRSGLKSHRHVYVFGDKFDISALPLSSPTTLVWDKVNIGMGNLSKPWAPQHELITFAVYVASKANVKRGDGALAARLRKGSVLRSLRANSGAVKHHPTEKPVDILRQMIESSSLLGEVVYDPFCGSGSTLVAAALEGRKAVGAEIDEKHCETAAKRLDKYFDANTGAQ